MENLGLLKAVWFQWQLGKSIRSTSSLDDTNLVFPIELVQCPNGFHQAVEISKLLAAMVQTEHTRALERDEIVSV